jgi:hypothetical protein
MAKNNTLKDLNDFLSQNPSEIHIETIGSKEEFLNQQPNSIVKPDEKLASITSIPNLSLKTITTKEIAKALHKRAEEENKSFAELWMEIIEEGAKLDPVLKNASLFKTIRTINKTSLNVALEGIAHLIKNK